MRALRQCWLPRLVARYAGIAFTACFVAAPLCAGAQGRPSQGRPSQGRPSQDSTARDSVARDPAGHRVVRLEPTRIIGMQPHRGVTRLGGDSAGHVYTGAATTLLQVNALPANTANSNAREVLGRVPGTNVAETRGGGFPSDGIAFRGLNPTQSIEVNVRQNGTNLAGDLYGYPETYYSPPLEAVDHIEVVRGASGLEYGPQFGGMVNYVLKDGEPNTAPAFSFDQSGASFGEYDGFASVGGGAGRLTYYAFGHYQGAAGWRQNANYAEGSGYAALTYRPTNAITSALQLSMYRSQIHMPGGLDDSEFVANPQRSERKRNWLGTPWNILQDVTTWRISPAVTWTTTLSGMLSQRYLVWRNEDGGPQAIDSIDPGTGQYTTPREVEREEFRNGILESRVGVVHRLWGMPATAAAGIRLFDGLMHRQEDGVGTTGSNFTMRLVEPYGTDMHFGTRNVAGYVQEALQVTSRLTVTPGVRAEWLESSIHGYTEDDGLVAFDRRSQTFALGGIGAEYTLSHALTLYGNITQAYRPVTYDNLIPFGSATTAIIDPHLHHASGYTSDLGIRGSAGPLVGDIDAFYLWYGDRIGTVAINDSVTETTNVADSRHYGVESYLELDLLRVFGVSSLRSRLRASLFDSFAWVDAHYTNGPYRGNEVEYAPPIINRVGPTLGVGPVSTSVTWNYSAKSYGDASNLIVDLEDPSVGVIPAYHVFDWSIRVAIDPERTVVAGIDNLTNARYFTLRAVEYPGPGIIPANGRTAYAGIRATVP